jgi:protease IV
MKQAIVVAASVAAASLSWACKGDGARPANGDPADEPGDHGGGLGLGGFAGMADPLQMLQNIAENLGKPGPYEAPAQSPGYQADAAHWAVLPLGGAIVELESMDLLSLSPGKSLPLRRVTARLRDLAADPHVAGILLRLDGLQVSLTDAAELSRGLAEARAAGKPVACHAEAAQNVAYLVLAACDRIALAPLGDLVISGPAAMPVHLKGLLAKVGVQADFLHVGAYKGAAEPLTRDAPSREMRETLDAILDRAYATMVGVIAARRDLPEAKVRALIDDALFSAAAAQQAGLVDEVATFETFRDTVTAGAEWIRLPVEPKDDPMAAMFKVARFLGVMPASRPTGPHVALVHAVGNIVDGPGDGTLGARGEIASATLVAALRTIAADDDVKAVVLRIDSGGGSARASELIWHAVSDLAGRKPVIVSMSDVAGSGGYYIAAPATKIYALEDTLTGSIGVVGGKLAPARGLAGLGVTTHPMGRGKRATMMASLAPWSADERAVVRRSMEDVYATFVSRVAAGRKLDVAAVEKLAAGRVWTGADAHRLGLVDAIGGLEDALAEAHELGGVRPGAVLEVYPAEPTLRDFVASYGETRMPWGLDGTIARIAAEVSPELAGAVAASLRQLLLLRDHRVLAIAPLPALTW